jgi:PD-(D/E)XK endonuclease
MAVMAAFQLVGYDVYIPFGENTRCDLIVDRGGSLARVQCKTGRLRSGAVVFALCSNYGHHRNPDTYHRSYAGEIDSFGVYCPETEKVAADYELARVAIAGLRAPSGA